MIVQQIPGGIHILYFVFCLGLRSRKSPQQSAGTTLADLACMILWLLVQVKGFQLMEGSRPSTSSCFKYPTCQQRQRQSQSHFLVARLWRQRQRWGEILLDSSRVFLWADASSAVGILDFLQCFLEQLGLVDGSLYRFSGRAVEFSGFLAPAAGKRGKVH